MLYYIVSITLINIIYTANFTNQNGLKMIMVTHFHFYLQKRYITSINIMLTYFSYLVKSRFAKGFSILRSFNLEFATTNLEPPTILPPTI